MKKVYIEQLLPPSSPPSAVFNGMTDRMVRDDKEFGGRVTVSLRSTEAEA
jgi:hypothetical protein